MNINVERFAKLLEDAGEVEKLAAFKKAIEATGSDEIEQSYLALVWGYEYRGIPWNDGPGGRWAEYLRSGKWEKV